MEILRDRLKSDACSCIGIGKETQTLSDRYKNERKVKSAFQSCIRRGKENTLMYYSHIADRKRKVREMKIQRIRKRRKESNQTTNAVFRKYNHSFNLVTSFQSKLKSQRYNFFESSHYDVKYTNHFDHLFLKQDNQCKGIDKRKTRDYEQNCLGEFVFETSLNISKLI